MEELYLENTTTINDMKKNVEWWHLAVSLLTVIIAMFGIVSMYATKTENHEQRITILESNRIEMKSDIKDIKASQTEILLILKDKQDRK